jgi:hypothetical protein
VFSPVVVPGETVNTATATTRLANKTTKRSPAVGPAVGPARRARRDEARRASMAYGGKKNPSDPFIPAQHRDRLCTYTPLYRSLIPEMMMIPVDLPPETMAMLNTCHADDGPRDGVSVFYPSKGVEHHQTRSCVPVMVGRSVLCSHDKTDVYAVILLRYGRYKRGRQKKPTFRRHRRHTLGSQRVASVVASQRVFSRIDGGRGERLGIDSRIVRVSYLNVLL